MSGLIITEFENIDQEPASGTIDKNKVDKLNERSEKRYRNIDIGDEEIYVNESKKNNDMSDVKPGQKVEDLPKTPKENPNDPVNNPNEQVNQHCRQDEKPKEKQEEKSDILLGENPNEEKKYILGADPNQCHYPDDTGLNDFQKEIIFSAIYFMLFQPDTDNGGKTKRSWESIGNRGYEKNQDYPNGTPLQKIIEISGFVNKFHEGEVEAWCAKFTTSVIYRALMEVDFIGDEKYYNSGFHVPSYVSSKNKFNFYKNPYEPIPSDKINTGTIFEGSAGAMYTYSENKKKGIPGDNSPKPGDIFYRPKPANKEGSGHVGIVVYYNSETTELLTIEGNADDHCKMKQYFKTTGVSPWGKPHNNNVNMKGDYKNMCYFLHVADAKEIKWQRKSKGLDLTGQFKNPKNTHLNKFWKNPLELAKSLKGTFWNPEVTSEESDR